MNLDNDARVIWEYMKMGMPLEKADAIFVLCSHDTRVAERAADLYKQGYAEWIIVSGGAGKLTQDIFNQSEAEVFKEVLVNNEIPEDRIILETKSTNTGENVQFVYTLLKEHEKDFRSFILVQKPYMERRTYATFKKQWPDSATKFTVSSPDLSYEEYMNGSAIDKDLVISVMMGDLQRIREYPKLGYQIEQEIPDEAWHAYERLVQAGYDQHLLS